MKIPISKLKAILLFFATYTDEKFLGKVKLMKLFYFTDFGHVKKHGVPITYDSYRNLARGPIPSTIMNLVDEVTNDIDTAVLSDTISIVKNETSMLHRITTTRKFSDKDEDHFTESELKILNEVCKRFYKSNAKEIEIASHKESAWKETKFLDKIPYSLVLKDSDCQIEEEDIHALNKIMELLGI